MKKLFVSSVIGLLTIIATIPYVFEPSVVYAMDQVVEEKLKELEKEKERIEQKKKDSKKDKKKTKKKLELNQKKQDKLEKEMKEIDKQVIETEKKIQYHEEKIKEIKTQIKKMTKKIENFNEKIIKLNKEIEIIQERIDKRSTILGNRLHAMQSSDGNITYLEVLFGSKDFIDFISRLSAIKSIIDQDHQIVTDQIKDRELIENKRNEIRNKKNQIQYQKHQLEEKESNLTITQNELKNLQKNLDKKLKEKELLFKKLQKEYDELASEYISTKEEEKILKIQSEIIKRVIEEHEDNPSALIHYSVNGGNNILLQPAIGRISSKFGMRVHPITSEKSMHRGIDIAAPTGTAVLASGSGVVTHAGYLGGYGNVIFVYHPDLKLTTVYAHLSKIHVSSGQKVKVGERIGDIGSTGQSTGPHLHFEVHVGQYNKANAVDPQIYLK